MKVFGFNITKQKISLKATTEPATGAQRATRAIRPVPKRQAAYQISDIKLALLLAKNPNIPDRKRLFEIYEYILKDGQLKSQIKVARLKVLSEPWLMYSDTETPDLILSKSLSKRWLTNIIQYILDAEFYGFSLIELDKIDPAKFTIDSVVSIDREYVSIERQWILLDGSINSSYLPYADNMQQMDLLEFGTRDDLGCLLECSYNVIFKFYSRSDWSRGSEKFGMPILVVEADTNNPTELDRLEIAAANFGTDGYMVTQKGDKATIIERQGQKMHEIWLDNIKYADDQLSKIINGQTASSDPKAFAGAANVQERTMEDFTLSRLQNVCDEMNEKIIPYLRIKGFPIAENIHFDYPSLIRERKRKIEGVSTAPPLPTEPGNEPANETADNKPQPKTKNKPRR